MIKVLLYAPIVNYSQYSKERHWIFMFGLEKNFETISGVPRHKSKGKVKKENWGDHLRGVYHPPNIAKTLIFRGLPDPLQVDPSFFFHFFFRFMSRNLRNYFKFFPSLYTKILWWFKEYGL